MADEVLGFPLEDSPLARLYERAMESVRRTRESDATFDAKLWSPAAIEAARAEWRARVGSEYASSTVFAQMAVQLVEANAPMDTTAVALRMAQEEVRHATLAGEVLVALGDDARVPALGALKRLSNHPGVSARERAMRNVIYGSISEVVNTARFVDTVDSMREPFLRDATKQLLADEIGHGQFGFLFLAQLRPWLDADADARARTAEFLRDGFARLERDQSGRGVRDHGLGEEGTALGLAERERYVTTFYATMEGAVVPGLERFGIAAGDAWKTRVLKDA